MKSQASNTLFTPIPNQSRPHTLYTNSNYIWQNRQSVLNDYSNSPNFIKLVGINEENNLRIYNFFASFGDIQSYHRNTKEGFVILRYKSDGCVKRATNAWSIECRHFPNISLKLINEEEKNQLVQENVANQNLYYPRNVKEEYYQDNKSKFWKFIDVLFNL